VTSDTHKSSRLGTTCTVSLLPETLRANKLHPTTHKASRSIPPDHSSSLACAQDRSEPVSFADTSQSLAASPGSAATEGCSTGASLLPQMTIRPVMETEERSKVTRVVQARQETVSDGFRHGLSTVHWMCEPYQSA
jgi:hypothetical protein